VQPEVTEEGLLVVHLQLFEVRLGLEERLHRSQVGGAQQAVQLRPSEVEVQSMEALDQALN
jgi:hypothetical protein